MSWINRFGLTNEEAKVINQYSAPEKDAEALTPGLFEGSWGAIGQSIGKEWEATKSDINELAALRVEDDDYYLAQQEDPFAPDLNVNKDAVVNRLRQDAKEARLKIKNDYTPNPETTGTAAMILYGLVGPLAKGIGYSVLAGGNPFVGGALFGADLGRYEKDKLQDKGVDTETATKAGLITGVTNAVGMALPASLGTSYLKSATFGALVNPATDITEQSAIKFVLDNADYSVISKEYDPFDPVSLTTSALMGAGFGLLGARGARVRAAREAAEKAQAEAPAAPVEGQTSRMNKSVLESIQNRDRSGKESRLQMQQIAQAPDFNRLRNGATLGEGTPVIAYLPENSSAILGKTVTVSDTNGDRTTMRYALIEASDVMTSNSVDGSLNADFTNPEVQGARAIAGNGRIAGLQEAYRNVKATKYKEELTKALKEFGISRRAVKKMREPILVRVMDDADVKEGVGELSNRTGTLKLNPAEQAAQDARNVRLEEVEFTKDNGIAVRSMDEFVRRTPDKEGLIDAEGKVIYDNVRQRMKSAIFAAAYPDNRLINRFIADDPKDKQVMDVLQAAAPEVVKLRRHGGDFDFSGDLMEALADYMQTKQEARKINGEKVEGEITESFFEATPVQAWFRDILLSKNPERLKDALARFNEVAQQESGGEGLFGKVSRDEVFNQVKSEFGALDRAIDSITPSAVDAAMELRNADVIEGDQPSGMNGDINRSIADEKLAREQLDDGEPVNVSGEGVDPETLRTQFDSFRDRVFNQLLGAGFKEKLAAYSADLYDAFYRTLGERLGMSADELEKRYALKIRKGGKETAESFRQQTNMPEGVESPEVVLNDCIQQDPIFTLNGDEFSSGSGNLYQEVADFFAEQYGGKVENPILGEVKLNKAAVKSSASHGLGRNKVMAFMAVPEVIKSGKIFDYQKNWKERRYDTWVLAAPILIKGKKYVCEVIVIDTGEHKRFYLHEVTPIEDVVTTIQDPYPGVEQSRPAGPVRSILIQRYFEDKAAAAKEAEVKATQTQGEVLLQSKVKAEEDFIPDQTLIDNAKDTFGVTDDIREAGYVLPDGTMLDFSGRHWGLDDSEARGQRQVDHIDISEADGIQNATGNEMYDFMAQTGAMRVSMADGNSVASIARPPTAQQLAVLGRATNREYLALSFNTPDGRIVSDTEFDSSSLKKIEKFLDDAQKQYERGEVSGAYAQDARGMYTPAEKMITLFGTADESTFVHESGHYFLDVMTDVAMRSDAPEQVRADIQTLMDWFGLKDLDEWNGLSLEEKRQFHEQFARGFEQYLRDGVAPSSRLEAIFKQFKDWLVSIYKSAADLDVELTPEVRDVYARMLATDKEITAKSEADSPSLFGEDFGRTVTQVVDNTNLPDETKAVIKDGLETLGIKTEQAPDQSKLSGVMTDDQFVQSRFDLDMEKYGDIPILDENGNETTPREMVAGDLAAAEQLEKDASGMSRAALCMFTNNAFD